MWVCDVVHVVLMQRADGKAVGQRCHPMLLRPMQPLGEGVGGRVRTCVWDKRELWVGVAVGWCRVGLCGCGVVC